MKENEFVEYRYYSSIPVKSIEWIWYPYIPCGKITLIQGETGIGKSLFLIQLIAWLTNNMELPGGIRNVSEDKIVYQCFGDDIEDTVMQRLCQVHVDCNKVLFVPKEDKSFELDDVRFDQVIRSTKAKILILDSIEHLIFSASKTEEIRKSLKRLSQIAKTYQCAILLVENWNGETLFSDAATISKSVLRIIKKENDKNWRILFHAKSNLAAAGHSIEFKLDPILGFQWKGHNGELVPIVDQGVQKKEKAKVYLETLLKEKDIQTREIINQIKKLGISEPTIRLAQKDLHIKSYKKGKKWYWHLEKKE